MRISTRYIGPTNTQGSKIMAYSNGKRKIIPWNYELDLMDNHSQVVVAFFRRENPDAQICELSLFSQTQDLKGYVFELDEVKCN